MATPVCWKLPSTMRDPGNCVINGGSESRERAKVSAFDGPGLGCHDEILVRPHEGNGKVSYVVPQSEDIDLK